MPSPLDESIQFLKHVGPTRARDFQQLGVRTVRDLLWTFPRDLSDRRSFTTIADAVAGEEAAFLVRPLSARDRPLSGRRHLLVVECTDDTGFLEAVWFNQPWLKDKFAAKGKLLLFGKPKFDYGRLKLESPQLEFLPEEQDGAPAREDAAAGSLNFGRIVPLYPCTGRLNQGVWRRVISAGLDAGLPYLEELYPPDYLERKQYPARADAIQAMHFPPSPEARARARERLAWDEALLMQLAILAGRRHIQDDFPGRRFAISPELDARIRRLFPFKPTAAQEKAIRDIVADMEKPTPMYRLLQGDVGSGKTAVATYALLAAVACGAQGCLLAPTGLLARQHAETLSAFLANSAQARVRVALLVGGMKASEKNAILDQLRAGAIHILVATHAALEDSVEFSDLGLVVIDEQHKFGVRQRDRLVRKGVRPDTLVMTATPIPRSLALTVYGDLDVTTIDELPPGRKPVRTTLIESSQADKLWTFVRRELADGRQAFIVCPLVEESETLDVAAAEATYEELANGALKGRRLGLMHGRMKRDEQRELMERFRSGAVEALVSTVVIEVGVDVPNATVMAVLHAERFGLAQLHQLRGRIGRGAAQGHFILLSDAKGADARERLQALVDSGDGFELAEEDLRLRGPGEFFGTKQHGLAELKLLDLIKDFGMIRAAREEAAKLLEADPTLEGPSRQRLRDELVRIYGPEWDKVVLG